MRIGKLFGFISLVGIVAIGYPASADPVKMAEHLERFNAASEELIEIYAESKALSARIAAVSERRAEAEAAIERALKTINHQDPGHGKLAEEAFAAIEKANRAVGTTHLEALEAETKLKLRLASSPRTEQE